MCLLRVSTRLVLSSILSAGGSLALSGCGGDVATPLGGPFGGTANVPPPTDGGNDAGPLVTTTTTTATTAPKMDSGMSAAPTWTDLWTRYLSVPHTGCYNNGCHIHDNHCDTPKTCFKWIGAGGGSQVSVDGGLFIWDPNGFMPPPPTDPPTSDPRADADFAAWIAAGALDN